MARHHGETQEEYVQRLASELQTAQEQLVDADSPNERDQAQDTIAEVVEEADDAGVLEEVHEEIDPPSDEEVESVESEETPETVVVADEAVVVNNDVTVEEEQEEDVAPKPDHWGEKRLNIFGKRN